MHARWPQTREPGYRKTGSFLVGAHARGPPRSALAGTQGLTLDWPTHRSPARGRLSYQCLHPAPCLGPAFADPLSPASAGARLCSCFSSSLVRSLLPSGSGDLPSLGGSFYSPLPLYLHTRVRTSPPCSQHSLHLSCNPCLLALQVGTLSCSNVNAPGAPH